MYKETGKTSKFTSVRSYGKQWLDSSKRLNRKVNTAACKSVMNKKGAIGLMEGVNFNMVMAWIIGLIIVVMFLFILIYTSSTMAGVVGLKDTKSGINFTNATTSKIMNESVTLASPATITGVDSTLDECTLTSIFVQTI